MDIRKGIAKLTLLCDAFFNMRMYYEIKIEEYIFRPIMPLTNLKNKLYL